MSLLYEDMSYYMSGLPVLQKCGDLDKLKFIIEKTLSLLEEWEFIEIQKTTNENKKP